LDPIAALVPARCRRLVAGFAEREKKEGRPLAAAQDRQPRSALRQAGAEGRRRRDHRTRFIWTEGVAWSKEGKFLVFSTSPTTSVHKWQDGKVSEYVKPSGYTGKIPRGGVAGDEPGSNGLLFDAEGRLTCASMAIAG